MVFTEFAKERHRSSVTLSEMGHFIGQLQYYLMFEVLESAWTALLQRLARRGPDLDEIVNSHEAYLSDILLKSMLPGPIDKGQTAYQQKLELILQEISSYKRTHVSCSASARACFARLSDVCRLLIPARIDLFVGWKPRSTKTGMPRKRRARRALTSCLRFELLCRSTKGGSRYVAYRSNDRIYQKSALPSLTLCFSLVTSRSLFTRFFVYCETHMWNHCVPWRIG